LMSAAVYRLRAGFSFALANLIFSNCGAAYITRAVKLSTARVAAREQWCTVTKSPDESTMPFAARGAWAAGCRRGG
jgi:hypothetical protein